MSQKFSANWTGLEATTGCWPSVAGQACMGNSSRQSANTPSPCQKKGGGCYYYGQIYLTEKLDPLLCSSIACSQPEVIELCSIHPLMTDQVVTMVGDTARPVHSLCTLRVTQEEEHEPVPVGEAHRASPKSPDVDEQASLYPPTPQAQRCDTRRCGRRG